MVCRNNIFWGDGDAMMVFANADTGLIVASISCREAGNPGHPAEVVNNPQRMGQALEVQWSEGDLWAMWFEEDGSPRGAISVRDARGWKPQTSHPEWRPKWTSPSVSELEAMAAQVRFIPKGFAHPLANLPIVRSPNVVATSGASALLQKEGLFPGPYIQRHMHGDWGDIGPEDWAQNQESLLSQGMLMSVYTTPRGSVIWAITDPGWDATTLLLPEEY